MIDGRKKTFSAFCQMAKNLGFRFNLTLVKTKCHEELTLYGQTSSIRLEKRVRKPVDKFYQIFLSRLQIKPGRHLDIQCTVLIWHFGQTQHCVEKSEQLDQFSVNFSQGSHSQDVLFRLFIHLLLSHVWSKSCTQKIFASTKICQSGKVA